MKSILKKELLISLSLLFCFMALGMFSIANGAETYISTNLTMEKLHKVRLKKLFIRSGDSNELEIKVESDVLAIDQGLIIGGTSQLNSSAGGVVGGGRENTVNGDNSGIGGGFQNLVQEDSSVIGGGKQNQVNVEGGTIAGGSGNNVASDFGVIVGGSDNKVEGENGVILGGIGNTVGKNALSLGKHATAGESSFSWGVGKSMQKVTNVAQIRSDSGVLIGTNRKVNGVSLVVDGAIKIGNINNTPVTGTLYQSGGCIYAYTHDGYESSPVGKLSLFSGDCGTDVFTCEFGKSIILDGDSVMGYSQEYSTGTCVGKKLLCKKGSLVLANGSQATGYYPNCYEIGSNVVFDKDAQVNTYTITYDCNGGEGNPNPQIVISGYPWSVRYDGCEKTGYGFAGRSENKLATQPTWTPGEKLTLEGDHTLYAIYGDFACGIIYDMNGWTEGSLEGESVTCGGFVEDPNFSPDRTCYGFSGWYLDTLGTIKYQRSDPVMKAITLYAKWTPKKYTIIYDCNGGEGESTTQQMTFGKAGKARKSGCSSVSGSFAGRSLNSGDTAPMWQPGAEMNMSSCEDSQRVYAIYVDKLTVSFETNGADPIDTGYVDYGDKATYPNKPQKTCHSFVGWFSDEALTTAYDWTKPVTQNIRLYAKWLPMRYKITYNCNGGESTNLSETIITYGGTGTLPTEGCVGNNMYLVGWSKNSKWSVGSSFPVWELGAEIDGELINQCENIKLYAVYTDAICKGETPANAKLALGSTFPFGTSNITWNRVYIDESTASGQYCSYVCEPGFVYVENYGIPQCVKCKDSYNATDHTCTIKKGCEGGNNAYGPDDDGGYSCQRLGSCYIGNTHPVNVSDVNGEAIEYKYVQPIGEDKTWRCTSGELELYQCQYKCKEGVKCGNDGLCGGCDDTKGYTGDNNGGCICDSANHFVHSGNVCVCDAANHYIDNGNGECVKINTVTFNANGGTTNTGSIRSIQVPSGTMVNLSDYIATKTDYEFMGWNTDSSAIWGWTHNYTVNSNVTMYAIYRKLSWSIEDGDFQDLDIKDSDGNILFTIMDRNLGATAYMNEEGKTASKWYGNYYQWGNNYGFPNYGDISTSTTQVNASGYGPNNYYNSSTYIKYEGNWSSVNNHNLWGGQGDTMTTRGPGTDIDRQGPCPGGYHVPSQAERKAAREVWCTKKMNATASCNNESRKFNIDLKLPFAGMRSTLYASTEHQESMGYYWSSSPVVTTYLENRSYDVSMGYSTYDIDMGGHSYRGCGIPVRCFKNSDEYPLIFSYNGEEITTYVYRWQPIKVSVIPENTTRTWYTDPERTQQFVFGDSSYVTQNTILYS